MRKLWVLTVVLGVLACCKSANAGCYDYSVFGPIQCTGTGGCTGEFYRVRCTWGCISGSCNNQGNSGECCGKIYYSAQIYPDQASCHCGELPTVARRLEPSSRSEDAFPASRKTRASVIVASRLMTPRLPRFTFVPDTCAHAYAVVVDDGTASPGGF